MVASLWVSIYHSYGFIFFFSVVAKVLSTNISYMCIHPDDDTLANMSVNIFKHMQHSPNQQRFPWKKTTYEHWCIWLLKTAWLFSNYLMSEQPTSVTKSIINLKFDF